MDKLMNVPVSEILKNRSSFEEEPKKKSREDWRKAKELEEARKAGTAPAAVDEEGRDINPHIPQYISVTPWYFGSKRPQPERQKAFSGIDEWYKRGLQTTAAAKRWRKGACENCGAITHKRKDCMERPRKVGAKYSNTQIAPDEFLQPDLSLDYDGKRDRWAGYDASEHRTIVEEFQKIEEAKKQMRAEKLQAERDEEQNSDLDEDKYVDEVDMPGTKVDSKQRITVRNLRIREDTAKYLRNLDPNSAYYDPKTRSMRDNPYAGTDKEVDYKGENSVRLSGDTVDHRRAEMFAWEAHEQGVDVHLLAEPTKLEKLKESYDENRDELKDKVKDDVIGKYGGKEYLKIPSDVQMLAQTEGYVEYSRSGTILKCPDKQIVRSRYEEDVHPNNHTSVWGSYWSDGNWGYGCCHSFVKNSYCTGEAGKSAVEAAKVALEIFRDIRNDEKPKRKKDRKQRSSLLSTSSSSDEEEDQPKKKRKKKKKAHKQDGDKLKVALRKEEENEEKVNRLMKLDERKRPYNSMCTLKEPTEEEMEAYHMKRLREDDPMAHFIAK